MRAGKTGIASEDLQTSIERIADDFRSQLVGHIYKHRVSRCQQAVSILLLDRRKNLPKFLPWGEILNGQRVQLA